MIRCTIEEGGVLKGLLEVRVHDHFLATYII